MTKTECKFKVGDLVTYQIHFSGTKEQIGLVLETETVFPNQFGISNQEGNTYEISPPEYTCKVLWFRASEVMLWTSQDSLRKVSHD